jgi:hypothetical protein
MGNVEEINEGLKMQTIIYKRLKWQDETEA